MESLVSVSNGIIDKFIGDAIMAIFPTNADDAVDLASRLEGLTKSYKVCLLISEHTYHNHEDAGKYCIRFVDRVVVKGKRLAQSVY